MQPIDLIETNNESIPNYYMVNEDYNNNNLQNNSDYRNTFEKCPLNKEEELDIFYNRYFNINYERTSISQSNINGLVSNIILFAEKKSSSPFENRNKQIAYNIPINSQIIDTNPARTSFQTQSEHLSSKMLLFDITKHKKCGRKKKDRTCKKDVCFVHTKYRADNIIMKIKVNASNNYLDHLNFMLKNSKNNHINRIRLRKVDCSIIKVYSKNKNLDLLDKKISDIISGKITKKFKNCDSLYNKKKIDLIFQKGDAEIINALNKTFRHLLELYCSKRTDIYLFKDFKKLENEIEKFKENDEDENYIQKYIEIANNFEETIKSIKPRKPKKKKEA